jgi:hypothetical protein
VSFAECTIDVSYAASTFAVSYAASTIDVSYAAGTIDVSYAACTIDVSYAAGTIDVSYAASTIDVSYAASTIDVSYAAGTRPLWAQAPASISISSWFGRAVVLLVASQSRDLRCYHTRRQRHLLRRFSGHGVQTRAAGPAINPQKLGFFKASTAVCIRGHKRPQLSNARCHRCSRRQRACFSSAR